MSSDPLTLGTAGHIDHGKTALVKALTGIDTDRLPEEKSRGMSIALGYASLSSSAGRLLSIIDVPGHERFVHTMVAGATGIDCFLMVVAADDGVMPQTVEHATVLDALGVRDGVIAITKADVADSSGALAQAQALLPECEPIVCSSRSGDGIDALRAAIERMIARLPGRMDADGGPVLHIDRSFTIRGQGTIVTGTLWSGDLVCGETLTLLPRGTRVRVRRLEVHHARTERAVAGQRVAVNLSGVRVGDIARGDVLAGAGLLSETITLDCALRLRDAEHNQRVQVHHGTRRVPGRLAALGDDLWQVRLEQPIFAADGDHLVIRRPSPPDTLGGGVVLDACAPRHGPRAEILDRLRRLRNGEVPRAAPASSSRVPLRNSSVPQTPAVAAAELAALEQVLLESWHRPLTAGQIGASPQALKALRANGVAVRVSGERYMHVRALASARDRTVEILEHHGEVTLARLRDELDTSRQVAQALLEYFDSARVTRRLPDDRRILSNRFRRSTTPP